MIDIQENGLLASLCDERDPHCREMAEHAESFGEYGKSPLEVTFAWAMSAVLEEFGGGRLMGGGALSMTLRDVEIEHGYGAGCLMASYQMHVWSQVTIGKYRADFLIAYRPGRRDIKYLVIECDGHDFHERTKEQAEHDRRRDREMLSSGIPVLRVTGAEVWRSPVKAAFDVLIAAKKTLEVRT